MQFENFIKQLADRLPFGISFNVSPDQNWDDKLIVAGFELNRYNDLSVSETWFANIVQELNTKRNSEAQIEIKLLAAKLKDAAKASKYPIDNLNDALGLLFNPVSFLASIKDEITEAQKEADEEQNPILKEILLKPIAETQARFDRYKDLLNSDVYSDFILVQTESYKKIADLSKMVESELSVQWVIVTFFMMSRCNEDWGFDRTARMPRAAIQEIYDFYVLESNKGIITPDLPGFEQDEEVPSADPKTGKVYTEEEKEALKLGKS